MAENNRDQVLKADLLERLQECVQEVEQSKKALGPKALAMLERLTTRSKQESGKADQTQEIDIQEDIEIALIMMKEETIRKINECVIRLEHGQYGMCFECPGEISEARLRALPFAVRCKDCEEAREIAAQRKRNLAQLLGNSSLFYDFRG